MSAGIFTSFYYSKRKANSIIHLHAFEKYKTKYDTKTSLASNRYEGISFLIKLLT